jgi:hydantoinase/carbamoylase family amidase
VTSLPTHAGERTLAGDLAAAAQIGAVPEGGINRFAWTPELVEVTDWVSEELQRLGLEVEIDAAGNLLGRWIAPGATAVMTASHLDTVPNGGAFDGTLGVLCAVEAVRQLRQQDFRPSRPIWVTAFMDEEGTRFGTALFGSRAFCGEDLTEALSIVDRGGGTMREAIASYGLDPDRVGEARAVESVGDYVELHIEQGPVLWKRGLRLAVVETIAGVLGYRVTVAGEANHAGTTPMEMRRDALAGGARMVLALREAASDHNALRATVGRIEAAPGATNVIPGTCTFTVDLRVARAEEFAGADEWLRELVQRIGAEEHLSASAERLYGLDPVAMDSGVTSVIEQAAVAEGVEPLRMVSGAGHDAMVIARHARAGMLLVPSRDGISHSPHEWTATADCELGARVLAGALRALAG